MPNKWKQQFNIVSLYYMRPIYLLTISSLLLLLFFGFGIQGNFSLFWLNDAVPVSCICFNGTLCKLYLQVGVTKY